MERYLAQNCVEQGSILSHIFVVYIDGLVPSICMCASSNILDTLRG